MSQHRESIPLVPPLLERLSDEEVWEGMRLATTGRAGALDRYRDELIRRLRPRLYRFFASLARSHGFAPDRVHDLADDLAQETVIRVAADTATARYLFGGRDAAAPPPDALHFPRVALDPFRYAFRTARNVWNSRVAAEIRARRAEADASVDDTAPSPWDALMHREAEEEWEARRRCGARLRAAEAECAAALAAKPTSARAHPRMNGWIAELWLWCSHQKGSAAAFYAAMGITERNTTRDLKAAEGWMRRCLEARGIAHDVVEALCGWVRGCAAAPAGEEPA
jgi:DNA-directed RNA polymerase specialized sigma24 family protein